jgi:hypothetical protein
MTPLRFVSNHALDMDVVIQRRESFRLLEANYRGEN